MPGIDAIYEMLLERSTEGTFGGGHLSPRHERLLTEPRARVDVAKAPVDGSTVAREQEIYGLLVERAGNGRFGKARLNDDEARVVFGK